MELQTDPAEVFGCRLQIAQSTGGYKPGHKEVFLFCTWKSCNALNEQAEEGLLSVPVDIEKSYSVTLFLNVEGLN
jgi:hypothetical protein